MGKDFSTAADEQKGLEEPIRAQIVELEGQAVQFADDEVEEPWEESKHGKQYQHSLRSVKSEDVGVLAVDSGGSVPRGVETKAACGGSEVTRNADRRGAKHSRLPRILADGW
jgi:hypothetical protein